MFGLNSELYIDWAPAAGVRKETKEEGNVLLCCGGCDNHVEGSDHHTEGRRVTRATVSSQLLTALLCCQNKDSNIELCRSVYINSGARGFVRKL